MACTITVDESAIQHTLPSHFFGTAQIDQVQLDGSNPNFLNLVNQVDYEILRTLWRSDNSISPGNPATYDENNYHYDSLKLARWLRQQGKDLKIHPLIFAAPANNPLTSASGNNHPYSIANIADSTDDNSVAGHQRWLQFLIDDPDFGLGSIHGYNPYNEPASMAFYSNEASQWYTDAADSGGGNHRDWASAKTKLYADGAHAVDPSIKVYGWVFAALGDYYWSSEFNRFLTPPDPLGGVAFPYTAPEHRAAFDAIGFHLYGLRGNFGGQSYINAMYYPTWDGITDSVSTRKSGYLGPMREIRTRLDSFGLTNTMLGMDEYEDAASNNSSDAFMTAAIDSSIALVSCRHQAELKIGWFECFALNCARFSGLVPLNDWIIYWDGVDSNPYNGTTHIPNFIPGVRFYVHKRIIGPFVHNYKKQLIGYLNTGAVVNGANSPATGNNNAVPRIQAASGLNNSETSIGFFLHNTDLSNSETINLSWTRNSSSNLTGYKMTPGIAYRGQDLTAVNITPSTATTASFTIAAGEVMFLEMNIAGGGAGSSTVEKWGSVQI